MLNIIYQMTDIILKTLLNVAIFSFSLLLFVATSLTLIIASVLPQKQEYQTEIIDVKAENVWFESH